MKYADLHIHSNYSDGSMTPEDIIKTALEIGVKNISITDHDSISSQYITNNENCDINIISGIELSTEYDDIELHILGYFFDVNNAELRETVEKLNKARLDRVQKILFNLKKDNINISLDDLKVDFNSTVGRSHVAKAMVRKGYFQNYKSAFTNYLIKGKPAYVKGEKLSYKEAIQVINNAGGISILAHPGQIYNTLAIEKIVRELKCYGLKGVEVYHPSHSIQQTNSFYNLCKKHKILITGGSDFHDKEASKDNFIGSYGINEDLFNKLNNSIK